MSGAFGIGTRFVIPYQQVIDAAGIPMVGATLTFYATGTTTLQNTYADAGLTIPNPNPMTADAAGRFSSIFFVPYPAYRVDLKDAAGGVVWTADPVGPSAGGGAPGTVPIGAIMAFAGTTPPSGWLWCDGQFVSRTAFAPLFSAIGTNFGPGDGATTFNVPDLRGRVVAGRDDMGGVAAGRLTGGGSGVDGEFIGAVGGSEFLTQHNHTLTDPEHTHTDAGHGHTTNAEYALNGGTTNPAAAGTFNIQFPTATVYTGYASIQPASTGITIDNAGLGSSQNVQPTLICNYIIFAG